MTNIIKNMLFKSKEFNFDNSDEKEKNILLKLGDILENADVLETHSIGDDSYLIKYDMLIFKLNKEGKKIIVGDLNNKVVYSTSTSSKNYDILTDMISKLTTNRIENLLSNITDIDTEHSRKLLVDNLHPIDLKPQEGFSTTSFSSL